MSSCPPSWAAFIICGCGCVSRASRRICTCVSAWVCLSVCMYRFTLEERSLILIVHIWGHQTATRMYTHWYTAYRNSAREVVTCIYLWSPASSVRAGTTALTVCLLSYQRRMIGTHGTGMRMIVYKDSGSAGSDVDVMLCRHCRIHHAHSIYT